MRRSAVILSLAMSSLVFITPGVPLQAQQTGVAHPMLLATQTYGESINAIAADGAGGFWFGGYTCSATLPTTSNAVQKTWSGGPCVSTGLLGRMKADGTITYLSYLGGSGGGTVINAVALATGGQVLVAGTTSATDFPTTSGAYARSCDACQIGNGDGFVTRLSPDGSQILFSSYLGGSGNDAIMSVAGDSNGHIHVVGSTSSGDFPVTGGALQPAWGGSVVNGSRQTDGFYTRFSVDGTSLDYSTYLGGSSKDVASGLAIDAAGNAFVVGSTFSQDFPTLNAVNPQGPAAGTASTFLAEFVPSGAAYSTFVGSSGIGGTAISVVGDRAYITGDGGWPGSLGGADAIYSTASAASAAYIAEVSTGTGTLMRAVALGGARYTGAEGFALAVDQNHVAYVAGFFHGNDCVDTCTRAQQRYETTWDAYKRELSAADADAILSIVDFGQQTPTVRYSTMLGGADTDQAFGVAADGAGGAFFAGRTIGLNSNVGPPPPPKDPGADYQSFVAHVGTQPVATPPPPADIVLYANDLNANAPSGIAGDWQIPSDSNAPAAAGGYSLYEPDHGAPKVGTPAAYPTNYFELTFLADANTPYHLWMRMRADADSYQNDSVWVQFSDTIDGGGNPQWRIHSTDATFVSLERCSGCGEQAWGWADNGYGAPGAPVIFATSGWHTIRIQQREDGVRLDQIALSSAQWANTPPGASKNDTTILSESYATPLLVSADNAPPAVSITSPASGATFTAPASITITASASDTDGTVSKVDFYANGGFIGTVGASPYTFTWNNVSGGAYGLTAVATDNHGATTTSSTVSVTVTGTTSGGLPAGWVDADIGATGAQGSATFANGTFTMQGAGADVWGAADAFNYVYMPLPADGTIIARVATVSSEASWVKAGVMIRSSLSPSSAQAFMLVSHAKGVAFQRRVADGDTTVSTSGSPSTAPHWVELKRIGSVIQGWESVDGSNWTFVGSDTFTMPQTVLVGLAVSSHVAGTLATATFDNVFTQSLPGEWGDADIGNVPFRGFANYDGSTFTVTGSGADIWGTADAFHYAWHLMNGPGTIVARVTNVDDVSAWVKAGVMIRDSFDPASPHAFVLVSHSRGVAFQRRQVAGGTSVSTAGSSATSPHWVKLTRSGDTFTAYESSDGATWTTIGSDTIAMAQSIYIGLAVTSHSTTSSATCTFDNVSIQ